MRRRLEIILKILGLAEEYVTIEEIARRANSSARTIHRDLDSIERSLSYVQVRLERRRGYGVRLLDPLPASYTGQILKSTEVESVVLASQRPFLMLVYLLLEVDWIKLSQLASDFYVSDSSVSSDLNALEASLPPDIVILRKKGVGVRLIARELVLRKSFVEILPVIFAPHRINTIISSATGSRNWLLNALKVREGMPIVENSISSGMHTLGMSFSPRHELVLISYLLLVHRRICEGGPGFSDETVESGVDAGLTTRVPDIFRASAVGMFQELTAGKANSSESELYIRRFKDVETALLARVLSILEPSGSINSDSRNLLGELYHPVKEVLELTMVNLEENYRIWLHDDHQLTEYLRATIASALRRVEFSSSLSIGDPPRSDHQVDSPVVAVLGEHAIDRFGELIPNFSLLQFMRSADEAVLALEARLARRRARSKVDMRVKILCYEGMGMTNYLRLLAEKVLPSGTRFDVEWESDPQRLEYAGGTYDLIISTFPMEGIKVPHVVVGTGKSQQEILSAIGEGLKLFQDRVGMESPPPREQHSPLPLPQGVSVSTMMAVLHDFVIRSLDTSVDVIEQAVDALGEFTNDRDQLRRDFHRREEYGSLVFEEYNIQLLHCRSSALNLPKAAVLQAREGGVSFLVMVTPAGATLPESRVLSEIVILLSKEPAFPAILSSGSLEEIQGSLLRHFGRLMEPSV